MLMNGMKMEGKKNVVIANSAMACHGCAMKYHDAHKDEPIGACYDAVRGKKIGKPMKVFPALRDPNGEHVYLCADCVKEIAEELSK